MSEEERNMVDKAKRLLEENYEVEEIRRGLHVTNSQYRKILHVIGNADKRAEEEKEPISKPMQENVAVPPLMDEDTAKAALESYHMDRYQTTDAILNELEMQEDEEAEGFSKIKPVLEGPVEEEEE